MASEMAYGAFGAQNAAPVCAQWVNKDGGEVWWLLVEYGGSYGFRRGLGGLERLVEVICMLLNCVKSALLLAAAS